MRRPRRCKHTTFNAKLETPEKNKHTWNTSCNIVIKTKNSAYCDEFVDYYPKFHTSMSYHRRVIFASCISNRIYPSVLTTYCKYCPLSLHDRYPYYMQVRLLMQRTPEENNHKLMAFPTLSRERIFYHPFFVHFISSLLLIVTYPIYFLPVLFFSVPVVASTPRHIVSVRLPSPLRFELFSLLPE